MRYLCSLCGGACWNRLWAALGIEQAEERCPWCGRWAKFAAQAEACATAKKAA